MREGSLTTTTASAERRFHQLATAHVLVLGLMVSWAEIAPWLVALVGIGVLAGSISPHVSVTRWIHRYFVAPLKEVGPTENAAPFLRTDAVNGCLALAGSMLVIVGVTTVGWVFVALCTADLFMDGVANVSPIRRIVEMCYSKGAKA